MEAIEFEGSNVVFAKDQPQYKPLPAHRDNDGVVTVCFKLEEHEKAEILLNGMLYVRIMTFDQPLQPILVLTEKPDI